MKWFQLLNPIMFIFQYTSTSLEVTEEQVLCMVCEIFQVSIGNRNQEDGVNLPDLNAVVQTEPQGWHSIDLLIVLIYL